MPKLPFFRSRPPLARWRRDARAVPVGDDVVLCRILGRHKLYADAADWGVSQHLMIDGYWEPRVTEAVLDLLRPGMVAIDVGANLGYFTLLMALGVESAGHVLAFEPHPRMGDLLARSMHLNGLGQRVTLHRCPLGAEEGAAVRFTMPDRYPGGGQVGAGAMEGATTLDCTARRLDAVPGALDAALVKIDAEGAEEAIWRGMAGLIAGPKLRHIILEFARDAYADPGALLDEALAAGFRLGGIDDVRGRVRTDRASVLAGAHIQMLLLSR